MNLRIPLLLALVACGSDPDKHPADSGAATGSPTSGALAAVASSAPEAGAVWLISWDTDDAATGWVEYGPTEDLGQSTAERGPSNAHSHALIALKAGRTYHWRAHSRVGDTELTSPIEVLDVPQPPGSLLRPERVESRAGASLNDGYLQMSQIQPNGESWLLILDGEGDVVWYRRAQAGTMIVTSRPAQNGTDVLYAEWDLAQQDDTATLYRVPFDGRSAQATVLDKGHHDFQEWADGTVGFVGFEADPSTWIASDSVVEVPEGATAATTPSRVWSWLDDYPVSPWQVCSHMAAGWARDPRFDEWTHSNSLMIHPDGLHYLLMSKFHDSLLKIRRSDGALIWQLNGAEGDFSMAAGGPAWTAVGQTALWSHAHASHVYDAAPGSGFDLCLAVFDNGLHNAPESSRAIEVCIDEGALTAQVTWSHDDPGYAATPLMGDVRKLDDSWLVGWADLGRIEELSPSGEVLWGVRLKPGVSAGRVNYLSAL